MEMLKCKTTIILILLIFGVAFIGGMDSASLKDNNNEYNVSANA